ncbi:MAG: TnpV protein [Ruminococcus flavefaciens]|nr:TnpV protein [Ruminococcus flavefaciens]
MAEIIYRNHGDYLLPDLTVPEEPKADGKYASLRRKYLKENHYGKYLNLLTQGRLNRHLMEIQKNAGDRMEELAGKMAREQEVTEQLKAENQMEWVQRMNGIRQAAEEIVLQELIYN